MLICFKVCEEFVFSYALFLFSNTLFSQDDTKENGKIEKKKKLLGHLYQAAKHIDFDSESNASSDFTPDENAQVFGPTTRRKWTEWTAKPSLSASASSSSPEKMENVSRTTTVLVVLICLVLLLSEVACSYK